MSTKAKKIISTLLLALPSFMLAMSGVMKLIAAPQVVEGLTKGGLGSYIQLFGIIELLSVVLLFIPKTFKIGFYLMLSYLGGAMSIELASGKPPITVAFLILLWVGAYLKEKEMFVKG